MKRPAAPPTRPSESSLASVIAGVWEADTVDELVDRAAEAIVAGTRVDAVRVELWGVDRRDRAVATAGIWPEDSEGGSRRLARFFARKAEADGRPLWDRSGNQLGTVTTCGTAGASAAHRDVDVLEVLSAQAGLAASYLRLLERYRRLEHRAADEHAELRVQRRAWRIALDESPIGMCVVGLQPGDWGDILDVNDAFCGIVGSEPNEAIGNRFVEFIDAADRRLVIAAMRRAADGRRAPANRHVRLAPLGEQPCRASVTITPVFDATGGPIFAVCHVRRADGSQEVTPPAAGTGSANALLKEKIRLAAKQAGRYGTAAAVLLCDLSDLAKVDGLTTAQRQQLVAKIARSLRGAVRFDDTVSHIDDHTVGVILDELDPIHAHTVAERLRKRIAELAAEHGAESSIGVTMIDSNSDPHLVMQNAATAMRQARVAPSRVVLYERSPALLTAPQGPESATTEVIRNRARRPGRRASP